MYNINNLKVISKNISRYNSNIYNKNKINYMIKKKQNLITQYECIKHSIVRQQLSLDNHNHCHNSNIINKINQLTHSLSIVIHSLDKIEEEEKLIMRVFKISNDSIINCFYKYF
jgi:hypothetical protein